MAEALPTWQPIATAPNLKQVWTKLDDGNGVRNVWRLSRDGHLWFVPGGEVHVYYTPTHWADDAPDPPESGQ